ncbi:FAD-dependent oxidoreductase [Pseudomonas sp. MAFF 301449]|uniref:Alkyl hydroperoxide reductase subunit F n=1 Tax=Pseudomonas cyclaminis TaxID=2781239 RepID=A0ABR9SRK7_9PSED|nr:FAD-dependent oxidoreductase [Pseudomonas cyclaminis]MBE8591554.1 FAD-dependent oxidoreductase [Pseudomonas cyclaminis]MBE8598644.1 FAD-dependent oxidoreductase [Pseudomonas cyclaminis]
MNSIQDFNPAVVDILIVGAGPTGLTLACDLARRGIKSRVIEKAPIPFNGSRGKGIQPRTLEVFNDLGVADAILRGGAKYPLMKLNLPIIGIEWSMIKHRKQTPDVPFPNTCLIPQWRTEEILRNRLRELGGEVEWGTEALGVTQDADGVVVQITAGDVKSTIRARYVVGADGGRSFVRKQLGVQFIGTTSQEGRMIVGDVHVEGLGRNNWHVWPSLRGGLIGLCPLPHTNLFQIMIKINPSEQDPELSESSIQQRWLAVTGNKNIRIHSPSWLSLFRPNVRLVEKYRVGRVLLAGDAAHVHTPAGAQGLNTGVQDAYNLGWKLALMLESGSDSLLDSYQEERMPVAAAVLEISSQLFNSVSKVRMPKLTRGDAERQLQINYRESSLSRGSTARTRMLAAGDRAPDAPCSNRSQGATTLFDAFKGTHFTLLAFGKKAIATTQRLAVQEGLLKVIAIRPNHIEQHEQRPNDLADDQLHARMAYGIDSSENVTVLVRPDGYIARIATRDWQKAAERYFSDIGVQNVGAPA